MKQGLNHMKNLTKMETQLKELEKYERKNLLKDQANL